LGFFFCVQSATHNASYSLSFYCLVAFKKGIFMGSIELSFPTQAFINGAWVEADQGASFPIENPSNGQVLAQVPDMGQAETRRAIEAADAAFLLWRERPAVERAEILRRIGQIMMAEQERLAHLMTLEQGKPLAESRGEIAYGASYFDWFADECRRGYGAIIPGPSDRRLLVIQQPIGVVGAITPWNFPNAMLARKMSAAIAAGCTVVAKPAELTPLSALALAEISQRAGLPAGVFNVVTTNQPALVGAELTHNALVRKITFTGSTEVGRILLKQASEHIQKCSMELGGNAPLIVFEDADLDRAVAGAIAAKYRNAGQVCIAANRFLVHASVAQLFAEKLATASAALKVGDGLEPGVAIGPLIEPVAVEKIERHIADAVARGAKILTGGNRHKLGHSFFEPTVLSNVSPQALIFHEETFGPVAPIISFSSEEEGLHLANATPFGLASYFYSQDLARIFRIAEKLESGMVGVNETSISTAVAPFGGVKYSGLGREGSLYGMQEYLEKKYICLGGIN
jgi:succinate-semialdehyde dehydrogenase/glutarate-semialdehyde dehydrogenase